MLRKEKEIPELYELKHFHDNYKKGYDYQETILKKTLSPHMYDNENMASFLNKINKLIYLLYTNFIIFRNFKNFFVDKYYNDHIK